LRDRNPRERIPILRRATSIALGLGAAAAALLLVSSGAAGRAARPPLLAFLQGAPLYDTVSLLNARTGGVAALRRPGAVYDAGAAGGLSWSPARTRVAFSGVGALDDAAVSAPAGIVVARLDGGPPRVLSAMGDHDVFDYAGWSANGQWIAFVAGDFDEETNGPVHLDLYVARPDGSGLRRLTADDVSCPNAPPCLHPLWSPRGGHIAFSGPAGVDVLDALAQRPARRRLLGAPDVWLGGWAPDGKRLVIGRDVRSDDAPVRTSLLVLDVATRRTRLVTTQPGSIDEAVWSPDGRRIAFTRTLDDLSQVYVVAAGGGAAQRLSNGTADEAHASWSPDGAQIAYEVFDAAESTAWIVVASADGSRARRLARGCCPTWAPR
jgi:Tol biopolymer transport system component